MFARPMSRMHSRSCSIAAAIQGGQGRRDRQVSVKTIDARLERQRDLYELGDITRDEYMRRREDLARQRAELATSAPQPLFVKQRSMLRTLVEDWEHVTIDERKRLVASIFEVIVADESALDFTPRESWKAYMRTVVPTLKTNESAPSEGGSERKTGLIRAAGPCARIRVREGGLDLLRRAA
jgi:hypothetical protein